MGDMANFWHVHGYPECKNAKPFVQKIDEPCPKCGGAVLIRKSKKKRNYYICENNPKSCDYISWTKPKKDVIEGETKKSIKKTRKKKNSKKQNKGDGIGK